MDKTNGYEVWQIAFLYEWLEGEGFTEPTTTENDILAQIDWECPEALAFRAGWDARSYCEGDAPEEADINIIRRNYPI